MNRERERERERERRIFKKVKENCDIVEANE